MDKQIQNMPLLALRGMTIMPEMVIHIDVSREQSIQAVKRAMQSSEQKIFLVAQRSIQIQEPKQEELYTVGTVATIQQVVKMPKNMLRVMVCGITRARLMTLEKYEGCYFGQIEILGDESEDETVMDNPKAKNLQEIFFEYAVQNRKISKEIVEQMADETSLRALVNTIAAQVPLDYQDLQAVLEETDLVKRCEILSYKIANEIEIFHLRDEIQGKVKERIDKHQKEYILREQLKVIREELGEDQTVSDAEEFEEEAKKLQASQEVKDKILKEVQRFKSVMNSAAESGVIRNYIETMLEMPWDKMSEDSVDIAYAKEILEEEHFGLEKVKERILEFLAVRTLTNKGDSPILCLVGPPGTGKTSIARSLAKALKKEYTRISLGGIRDEAEIRGHRKTYVGAMPGRIANALKQAGVKNPLLLLDEIDKVSNDYKGDTFSALLEVLDSEQNVKFRDHYLEVPIDLSEVLFVATANSLQTIPRPLLDRMEVIEVSSYTENEKLHIAMEHLVPKQLKRHGLTEAQLEISEDVVWKIARNYTKEAGVRQLERKIGDICRKSARKILEENIDHIYVDENQLESYLGKEKYADQMINETDEVGIVRGLAWTSVGGDTLQIEVNVMPGEGEILLTGQLGDVMKESARTGISYIRSVGEMYGIPSDYFKKHDVHIHIPEGAVPKDGPSAGITMATAMISAVTHTKVRANVAMTGEITLRGRVLPIGGLKEKLLAAKNAGVKTVLVPEKNKIDVEELSEEITDGLEIIPVTYMDEVLKHALIYEDK